MDDMPYATQTECGLGPKLKAVMARGERKEEEEKEKEEGRKREEERGREQTL